MNAAAGEEILPTIRILNPEEKPVPLAATIPAKSADSPKNPYAERPPWVVDRGDGVLRCYIGTGFTASFDVRSGASILRNADALVSTSARIASISALDEMNLPSPKALRKRPEYWRSHYYGIMTVHRTTFPKTGEPILAAVLHGENKDVVIAKKWAQRKGHEFWQWPNTLLPESTTPLQMDEHYFGFIGLAWAPANESNGGFMAHDQGPILWPQAGYIDADGAQASHGVRHAYGLINGGFLYVFYLDTTDNEIRAARAPLDHLFERGAFRLLANGAYSQPALPEGFDPANKSFLKRKPGRADPILPGAPRSMRFQAARLRGTPYFLGIEHRLIKVDGKGSYEAWLHLSRDLIHWSDGTAIPGSRAAQYAGAIGQRPVLVNRDYSCLEEVDPDGFYIAGRSGRLKAGGIQLRFTRIALESKP